jgi:hypothetical protein
MISKIILSLKFLNSIFFYIIYIDNYINIWLFFRIAQASDDDETFFTDYMDHEEHFICWDRKSEMNVS